jgi:N6-L-threonylcarbamoyladenine synthase
VPVADEAIRESGVALGDIDAVAATYGPGLIGALLVGLSFAKGLALARNVPFIGVNHVAAHILAASLSEDPPEPPFTALVVSGGHSGIYFVEDYRTFRLAGRTRDDAAGEAFDKAARAAGLGYPGGRRLEAAAAGGDPRFVRFPRTVFRDGTFDFSFSGVKTAAMNYLRREKALTDEMAASGTGAAQNAGQSVIPHAGQGSGQSIGQGAGLNSGLASACLSDAFYKDFYASYQAAIVDALVMNAVNAERALKTGKIVLAGGVAANGALRDRFRSVGEIAEGKIRFFVPARALCTDNAAMVAARAYHDYAAGVFSPLTLNASSTAQI